MSEKFYDEEIAPKLMEIGKLCQENNIPFLAVVEYTGGMLASTKMVGTDECIEMTMIRHCAKTAPNIDGYVFGLCKWAGKNNIDMSGSLVMTQLIKNR